MRTSFIRGAWQFSCAIVFILAALTPSFAQQVADPDFTPTIDRPAYEGGAGPTVLIDEAHHNFHTAAGRYAPFANLLRRDGFRVTASTAKFTPDALAGAQILVIANALSQKNLNKPSLPTYPAFSPEEVEVVSAWVRDGGALLLIADHMPWGGAAASLAAAFGFVLGDGFAIDADGTTMMTFGAGDGLATDHPVVSGRSADETVASVATFTGQAFHIARGVDARPLLTVGDRTLLLMPVEAWKFTPQTPRFGASGMLQGATRQFGSGRVAVFGEAAMFTAQISENRGPMGMNHPNAKDNAQFALNVMHWLAGLL